MVARIRTLLGEIKQGLQDLYGRRLRGVYLFGSFVRGEEDPESDVDILIVLDHCDLYGREIDHSGPLIAELSLKYGVSISRVFVSEEEWRQDRTRFLVNVRQEAIPA